MEKVYKVRVIETIYVDVPILAETEEEAIERAEEMYSECEIVLGDTHEPSVSDTNFKVIN